eukprot:14293236-Alexandrium_andersonii.AAC.1
MPRSPKICAPARAADPFRTPAPARKFRISTNTVRRTADARASWRAPVIPTIPSAVFRSKPWTAE